MFIDPTGKGIIITGGKGALALQLKKVFPSAIALDKAELNVVNVDEVKAKLTELRPAAIINCAAYNNVDGAETDRENAFALNAEVPKNLAQIAKTLDIPFVHFSTGYVFDGSKEFYSETDAPSPISVYAESKARGEKNVAEIGGKFYIIRTNVLFGPKGESEASKPSFVDIMLNVAKKTNTIKAVADEINSITYTPDLAQAAKDLLLSGAQPGLYHTTNSGFASWYEFAKEIFTQLGFVITDQPQATDQPDGKHITLLAVPGSAFSRTAKRPGRVVLQNNKLPLLRTWQEAVREYLHNGNVS